MASGYQDSHFMRAFPKGKGLFASSFGTPFLLYIFCGGIATIFDWGSFYVTNDIYQWNYLFAVSLSFLLGTLVNFTTNKIITFRNRYKNIPLQYGVFLIGGGCALFLTYLQMILFIEALYFSPMQARIIVTGIMLFFNFGFHKYFTFGKLK